LAIIREGALQGDKELVFETGRMARQAGGSILVQYGETVVLVAATEGGPRAHLPFFPLTVEYQEKTYAAGRIPGGFFKREGRLGETATLTCRLIDRPVRPLFPKAYQNDTQIICTVLSHDQENDPAVIAITGASTALMISDIPFNGPVAGVRVGRVDGEFVANPTETQRAASDMDIILACTEEAIVMVEGGAKEADEETMLSALDFGWESCKDVLALQHRLREACGKKKLEVVEVKDDPAVLEAVQEECGDSLMAALTVRDKLERQVAIRTFKNEIKAVLAEEFEGQEKEVSKAFEKVCKLANRRLIAREKIRLDGRKPTDIRQITSEVSVLPRTHGSALFTRGETQALVVATLGTSRDQQRIDSLTGASFRNFMLHYNFPPFCVGETKPLRGPGRREIGHGMLAHRAISAVLPDENDDAWPYAMRLVSEVLESNGSSSMASVCGGSLALMDAGVPLTAPVAGIAMGLIVQDGETVVLSDILGDEDHFGDMDFKVCGTEKGITAFQMDTKIAGVTRATMKKALMQARDGRLHILGEMASALAEPRKELNEHAPRIITIKVKPSQIGTIIGSGGKTIRGIIEQTGVAIDVQDDGSVNIASANQTQADKAIEIVRNLTQEPEAGKLYMGTVKKIMDFGAFIEILPGTDGLCHISELTDGRVERVEDVVSEGDEVLVKCLAVDRSGKIRLSRKEALAEQKPS
jgi:polyribonucleotide nucleotidyltransferase